MAISKTLDIFKRATFFILLFALNRDNCINVGEFDAVPMLDFFVDKIVDCGVIYRKVSP